MIRIFTFDYIDNSGKGSGRCIRSIDAMRIKADDAAIVARGLSILYDGRCTLAGHDANAKILLKQRFIDGEFYIDDVDEKIRNCSNA